MTDTSKSLALELADEIGEYGNRLTQHTNNPNDGLMYACEAELRRLDPMESELAALKEALRGLEPVAYLYRDPRTANEAHPWLKSTMVVLAAERRPELRGEIPLRPAMPLTDEQKADLVRSCKTYLDFEMIESIEDATYTLPPNLKG